MLEIKVGQVFLLWCAACRPDPKYKYFVVALVEPRVRYFLINSNPSPLQNADPELLAELAPVMQADHKFLRHDSFLDLTQLMGGPTAAELEDKYLKENHILLGNISTNARRNARRIIGTSISLTGSEVKQLEAIW